MFFFFMQFILAVILFQLFCSRFLKSIDRFNDLVVSVYVTAGHILLVIEFWFSVTPLLHYTEMQNLG